MRKEWANLKVTQPMGFDLNFTVLINIEDDKNVPSVEEASAAIQKCLILNQSFPLPQNYSIN